MKMVLLGESLRFTIRELRLLENKKVRLNQFNIKKNIIDYLNNLQ